MQRGILKVCLRSFDSKTDTSEIAKVCYDISMHEFSYSPLQLSIKVNNVNLVQVEKFHILILWSENAKLLILVSQMEGLWWRWKT